MAINHRSTVQVQGSTVKTVTQEQGQLTLLSMQQSLQSPTTTIPSTKKLQSSSASIEFQTRKDNDGDNEISSDDK